MAYWLARTEAEIDDLLNQVNERIDDGDTKFGGMTFEQGVADTVLWLTGQSDEHPYED